MNNNSKKVKNQANIKDIALILVLLIASIFFFIIIMNKIRYFSYKEVEATLISRGSVNSEYQTCTGTFKYIVNGVEYEASISMSNQDCTYTKTKTIYYDENDPQKYTSNKSVAVLIVFVFLDLFAIGGLFVVIKSLFSHQKNNEKTEVVNDNKVHKRVEYNHHIYGKYGILYDSDSVSNKYGIKGIKCLDLVFEKTDSNYLSSELAVYLPEEKINGFFEVNHMNNVLDSYHNMKDKLIVNIKKAFINQEITNLSTWYEVSDSPDDKRLLNDKGNVHINGIKLDSSLNIIGVSCSYNYQSDDVATFSFSYDIRTEKVENVDVSS